MPKRTLRKAPRKHAARREIHRPGKGVLRVCCDDQGLLTGRGAGLERASVVSTYAAPAPSAARPRANAGVASRIASIDVYDRLEDAGRDWLDL